MAAASYPRPNAREIWIGAGIAAAVSLAASSCVLLFDLHPAVSYVGGLRGMGLGVVQSRRMMHERVARSKDLSQRLKASAR